MRTLAIWANFAKALISENGHIALKYEKLLLCKGYHILIDSYQSYKQLSIGKDLPPQMVPICGLAHGLIVLKLSFTMFTLINDAKNFNLDDVFLHLTFIALLSVLGEGSLTCGSL